MSRLNKLLNDMPDAYEKTVGYLVYDILAATGIEMDKIDVTIADAKSKLNVDNLTGNELELFISQRKGLSRKQATNATGIVVVTGTGTVTKGDLFETALGVQFEATETVKVTKSGQVNIKAISPGNIGVVGANTIVQMPVTISGIASCTNDSPTEGGYDAESDDNLRGRYYLALKTPSSSGNKYDYLNWALAVTGVGGAKVYPLEQGANTVDVVIINEEKKPASTTLVTSVQNYIDPSSEGKGNGAAPIGAHCYVSSAGSVAINIAVKITKSTDANQIALENLIKANITDYLKLIAFISNTVSYAQIGNVILDTTGVLDYENLTVNNSTANISIADKKIAVLAMVVFTYA